jgi:hypothetical protein
MNCAVRMQVVSSVKPAPNNVRVFIILERATIPQAES